MENCLFCAIAENKVPSFRVYEDHQFYAILDINPMNQGHILLTTKAHYKNIMEMPEPEYARFFLIARGLALALLEYGAQGVNFWYCINEVAGQRLPHLILHVIPRMKDDNIFLSYQPKKMDETQLAQVQQRLIEKIQPLIPRMQQQMVQQQQPQLEQKPKAPEKPVIMYRRSAGYW